MHFVLFQFLRRWKWTPLFSRVTNYECFEPFCIQEKTDQANFQDDGDIEDGVENDEEEIKTEEQDDSIETSFRYPETLSTGLVSKFGLESAKHARTPMGTTVKLARDSEGINVDQTTYRSMIGSLLYLTTSRSDIAFSVGVCAQYQASPKESHLSTVKHIIKYMKLVLCCTIGMCFWLLGIYYSYFQLQVFVGHILMVIGPELRVTLNENTQYAVVQSISDGALFYAITKLRMFVVQEPVVAASCLIAGVGLFLPAVVRPILDSFETSKQAPPPALNEIPDVVFTASFCEMIIRLAFLQVVANMTGKKQG
ncbi:hypothetical protein RHSIM_Rhsim01G0174400 [Rhododendron simsii]|uniref:Mitochondrial protein n=1 Tax=Rhododendron simsii TaxID=118357 RepID=A0A834HEQ6_RHOSS|nr:hypothetical protein RHSIM_Rhsim01G0174400 [Rhododendron simsii]